MSDPLPQHPATAGCVIFVKDKHRVSAFYQRTLNLTLSDGDAMHDVLHGDGIELVIHAIPPQYSADIVITIPPQIREDSYIKPAFFVADLNAVRVAAESTGGLLNAESKAFHFRGMTVLDGSDPEGNVVQFKQRDR
jgi:predicted enzyme related to lactoylglutathione lyase